MRTDDPFPDQHLLDAEQVRRILGMEKTTFARWWKTAKGFPKPVDIGPTPKGRPVLRWKKVQVLAYIDLLGS